MGFTLSGNLLLQINMLLAPLLTISGFIKPRYTLVTKSTAAETGDKSATKSKYVLSNSESVQST